LHAGHTGEKLYIPIDEIIVGEHLAKEAKSLIEKIDLGESPIVVCDTNTDRV
jgi:hypothetical protein